MSDSIDRYEANSIAEHAAQEACNKLERDIRFDYERAIRQAKADLEHEIARAIREHVTDSHPTE